MRDYEELVARLREAKKHIWTQPQIELYPMMNDAADAIEELCREKKRLDDKAIELQAIADHYEAASQEWFQTACEYNDVIPKWISVEDRLPEFHVNDSGCVCTRNIVFRTEYKTVHLGYVIRTAHNIETVDGFEQIIIDRWYDQAGDMIEGVTHWMPLPEPPKEE